MAVFSTVSTTRTNHLTTAGDSISSALTGGFSLAFWVAVGFGVAGLVATLTMIHREELGVPAETASPG